MAYPGALQKMMGSMVGPLGSPPPSAAPPPFPGGGSAAAGPPLHAPAELHHRHKQDAFAHAAIKDFLSGGITRAQLVDALSNEDAYDYASYKKQSVVHPTQAGDAHNEPPPEPPQPGPG